MKSTRIVRPQNNNNNNIGSFLESIRLAWSSLEMTRTQNCACASGGAARRRRLPVVNREQREPRYPTLCSLQASQKRRRGSFLLRLRPNPPTRPKLSNRSPPSRKSGRGRCPRSLAQASARPERTEALPTGRAGATLRALLACSGPKLT